MDVNKIEDAYNRANASGDFANIDRLVVENGLPIRLVGEMESSWEHFVDTAAGIRPYYCEGPSGECPLCQAAAILCASDNEVKQKIGANIKAKEKFYFACLSRTPEGKAWHGKNKKAYVLSQNAKGNNIGQMLLKAIGEVVTMRKKQGQDPNPQNYDIILTKHGQKMQTKYGAQFTGITDPLTDEEKAYELPDLKALSKHSAFADRKAIADQLLGGSLIPTTGGNADFNVNEIQAAMAAQQMAAPPPAAAPTPPPPQPAALPRSPAAPAMVPQGQYADTNPEGKDPKTGYPVPCSDCGAQIFIAHTETRDFKCHSCGKVYGNPKKVSA